MRRLLVTICRNGARLPQRQGGGGGWSLPVYDVKAARGLALVSQHVAMPPLHHPELPHHLRARPGQLKAAMNRARQSESESTCQALEILVHTGQEVDAVKSGLERLHHLLPCFPVRYAAYQIPGIWPAGGDLPNSCRPRPPRARRRRRSGDRHAPHLADILQPANTRRCSLP